MRAFRVRQARRRSLLSRSSCPSLRVYWSTDLAILQPADPVRYTLFNADLQPRYQANSNANPPQSQAKERMIRKLCYGPW